LKHHRCPGPSSLYQTSKTKDTENTSSTIRNIIIAQRLEDIGGREGQLKDMLYYGKHINIRGVHGPVRPGLKISTESRYVFSKEYNMG